jgi:RNA polymerase-binding transcription factor DksA
VEAIMTKQPTARSDHEQFRQILRARRAQLLGQMAELEGDLQSLRETVEIESVEEGQEQSLAAVLESLDEHDRAEVEAIDAALQRISDGRYGICAAFGAAIPPARLQALPTALFCVPCAAARESPRKS